MHGRHQNKERSLSADPDTQSDRREMELKILWHILQGDNRFSELKKEIPGISEKVLYSNLKELEDAKLLYREVIKEKKPSVIRYRLSEESVEVRALIDAAHRFANRYAKKAYTY